MYVGRRELLTCTRLTSPSLHFGFFAGGSSVKVSLVRCMARASGRMVEISLSSYEFSTTFQPQCYANRIPISPHHMTVMLAGEIL